MKGEGVSGNQKVSFDEVISGEAYGVSGETRRLWNLKVYPSGTTRLGQVAGSAAEEDIDCHTKNVFQVAQSNYGGDWEKSVATVKLTLNNCNRVNVVEKCDIGIDSGVGLQWNPQFKPKAIFK